MSRLTAQLVKDAGLQHNAYPIVATSITLPSSLVIAPNRFWHKVLGELFRHGETTLHSMCVDLQVPRYSYQISDTISSVTARYGPWEWRQFTVVAPKFFIELEGSLLVAVFFSDEMAERLPRRSGSMQMLQPKAFGDYASEIHGPYSKGALVELRCITEIVIPGSLTGTPQTVEVN